jgi:pimeloyl-ACP methyl ester carboxylesterase
MFFRLTAGWGCIALECRGHGESEAGPPEHFSISTFAADVESLIEARALAPVAIGGI